MRKTKVQRRYFAGHDKGYEAYYVLYKIDEKGFEGHVYFHYDDVFKLLVKGFTMEGVAETLSGAEEMLFSVARKNGFPC